MDRGGDPRGGEPLGGEGTGGERPRVARIFSFSVAFLLLDSDLDLRAGALLPEELELELDEELELEEEDEDEPLPLSLLLELLLELLLDEELPLLELELLLEESLSLSEEELLLSAPFFSSFIFCSCSICSCICSANSFGAFFRCSRRPSVRLPRPIEVKKLIAKRVFLALSVGKRPENTSCMKGSLNRSFNTASPIISARSCTRILMKIRDDEVVSYSFSLMYSRHVQGSASVHSRWPMNFATLRSLFVSRRWIVLYCVRKTWSKASWYLRCIIQKR